MRYAYYPGCSLHSTAKDYDISARAVCQALGIELQEIPGWICCGASSAHMTSEVLGSALPVKNLVLARELDLGTAVACAACYSRLRIANQTMASEDDLVEDIDHVVGARYRGEVEVKHLLEIVTRDHGLEALGSKVSRPLTGLRVAAYYGCLLVRPAEAVAFDDVENPTAMDELVAALGAEAVAWPYKTECCGAGLGLSRTDVVLKLTRDILEMATSAGAECLLVACPLCQSNLDLRQAEVNKRYDTSFALPVLYFTQLIGLALGLSPKEMAIDKLIVDAGDLLGEKGLVGPRDD